MIELDRCANCPNINEVFKKWLKNPTNDCVIRCKESSLDLECCLDLEWRFQRKIISIDAKSRMEK
jgi:hypothetical protein